MHPGAQPPGEVQNDPAVHGLAKLLYINQSCTRNLNNKIRPCLVALSVVKMVDDVG